MAQGYENHPLRAFKPVFDRFDFIFFGLQKEY